ncbi:MAG: Glycerophosphocholine phosphodiesterase [Pleopsidium flavum]|nr:MAG: Glycerophosphocholine phosphodiesterase [Pleopsidium flavum]
MKFGRNLARNQVPEWSSSYINYKALKKLVKSAADNVKHGGEADLAEFFYSLDRNLEDVDTFYNRKFGESARRLQLLQDRYGKSTAAPEGLDRDEVEDLMGALLELRGQLRKLQWYGEVNRRGFIKITKKLDKKVPYACAQRRYLESKVDPKPFATNVGLSDAMNTINNWLSMLGDANVLSDASSSRSSNSIRRVSSKAILNLPPGLLDTVDQAIRNDDASILLELLLEANTGSEDPKGPLLQRLLLNLLQRAISCQSKACIDKLLDQVTSLDEEDDINDRNCIHRLIITIGRSKTADDSEPSADAMLQTPTEATNYITPAAAPVLTSQAYLKKEPDGVSILGNDDKSVQLLEFLLYKLRPEHRSALKARDTYGRTPLHYAAQYGFIIICQIIIRYMQSWCQFDVTDGIDAPVWQDAEGWAPLHLSVMGGHPLTTKTLLEAENWKGATDHKVAVRKHVAKSSAVLALATKANFVVIVDLLVEAGVDINYQDEQGETALHVAARFGHEKCAKLLLDGTQDQRADTEIAEKTFGWTPLFIASVDGHLRIVDLLVDAGADLDRPDLSGWTSKEHASLRGHMDIAKKLAALTMAADTSDSESSTVASTSPPLSLSMSDRKSRASNINSPIKTTEPVKTFGHRYLTNESMVLVSLGTMDTRKVVEAVKLDRIPLADAHSTQLDTALSIVVSASGANGEPSIIDLPVQDNVNTDPIVFTTVDASKVKVLFDIVPTYAGSKDQIVGRGVALLSSVKPSIGSKRITLQGDNTVPIMAANTLEVIGSVNFNFLIITPFKHPSMSITENQTYWKSMTSTMVIGHRGLGKNMAARKSLQLGENTIQVNIIPHVKMDCADGNKSFIAAANLGASYVELTKDHVPVIYHDFLVSETGIDAPVHTLTLEQFLHVSDNRTPRPSRPASPVHASDPNINNVKGTDSRRHRSMSLGTSTNDEVSEMSERMKHTRDFKQKGFKGNSRGNFIQAPFTTLEEMFKKLPESIGFNIEMKYPMLHESEEQEMDTYAVELNSFVDTVLTKVYDLGKKRNVIFSSFNPDICLLLSFKQPSIPILFLTDAGTNPVGDIRASSLQEAIRFASRWNLLGIVSAAEPLVISPRLVRVVKESGLVCVSYGTMNNDPDKVKLQVKEGIDAVIVDNVLAIRKGLTGSDQNPAARELISTATNGSNQSSNGVSGESVVSL